MKNRKLLTALASTAGLAAVVAPAVCMTSCSKSHFSISKEKAVKGTKDLTFSIQCSSLEKNKTAAMIVPAYVTIDGKMQAEMLTSQYFTLFDDEIKDDAKVELETTLPATGNVELVCFAVAESLDSETSTATILWNETFTINFVISAE